VFRRRRKEKGKRGEEGRGGRGGREGAGNGDRKRYMDKVGSAKEEKQSSLHGSKMN